MTHLQAIEKIKEIGFFASFWAKSGKQRIYIEFNFHGKKKEAGFIGSDATNLLPISLGSVEFQQKWNAKISEVAQLQIEWNENKTNASQGDRNSYKVASKELHSYHYSSLAERDRIIENGSWELSHDL